MTTLFGLRTTCEIDNAKRPGRLFLLSLSGYMDERKPSSWGERLWRLIVIRVLRTGG